MSGTATVMDQVVRGECEVPERVKRMIAFLLANASKIQQLERVAVTFHCAGRKIRTEVNETGEA